MYTDKRILITGGTGSLGKVLLKRLLAGEMGLPKKVIVFSRDEAKQYQMRVDYANKVAATDEVIYRNFQQLLEFRIGDVRDLTSVTSVLSDVDVVFNAAALKQVPTCEYFPYEAVRTNVTGAENVVRAIEQHCFPIDSVVGISTDKACEAVNVMGMTKAIQERIFIQANLHCRHTRFICVRYGNVLASRGSVVPLFAQQIREGGPLTITTPEMTRFVLSLDQAVDTIFQAAREALPGETYVPRIASARIVDVASALIGDRDIKTVITGIRPGEKVHEKLVSDEEGFRTIERKGHYVILPMLPELRNSHDKEEFLGREYSSADDLLSREEVRQLLERNGFLSAPALGELSH